MARQTSGQNINVDSNHKNCSCSDLEKMGNSRNHWLQVRRKPHGLPSLLVQHTKEKYQPEKHCFCEHYTPGSLDTKVTEYDPRPIAEDLEKLRRLPPTSFPDVNFMRRLGYCLPTETEVLNANSTYKIRNRYTPQYTLKTIEDRSRHTLQRYPKWTRWSSSSITSAKADEKKEGMSWEKKSVVSGTMSSSFSRQLAVPVSSEDEYRRRREKVTDVYSRVKEHREAYRRMLTERRSQEYKKLREHRRTLELFNVTKMLGQLNTRLETSRREKSSTDAELERTMRRASIEARASMEAKRKTSIPVSLRGTSIDAASHLSLGSIPEEEEGHKDFGWIRLRSVDTLTLEARKAALKKALEAQQEDDARLLKEVRGTLQRDKALKATSKVSPTTSSADKIQSSSIGSLDYSEYSDLFDEETESFFTDKKR